MPTKPDPTAPKRKATERAAKRAQGLAPMEVWSYPECFPAIREHAAKLTGKRRKSKG
jgi:hypothetical protein